MADKWAGKNRPYPPGNLIREELETRGWTQQELANRMRRPVQIINMIINGHKSVTPETALQLEHAFGASADFWLGLDTDYRLYLTRQKQAARKNVVVATAPAKSAAPNAPSKSRAHGKSLPPHTSSAKAVDTKRVAEQANATPVPVPLGRSRRRMLPDGTAKLARSPARKSSVLARLPGPPDHPPKSKPKGRNSPSR